MASAILAAATSDRIAVRRALAAERTQVRRYHAALASADGGKLRARCGRQLDASLDRAAGLTLLLIDMGEAIPTNGLCDELIDRLLDAMNANLRQGEASARAPRSASVGPLLRANSEMARRGCTQSMSNPESGNLQEGKTTKPLRKRAARPPSLPAQATF